jgi:hypothetical protein
MIPSPICGMWTMFVGSKLCAYIWILLWLELFALPFILFHFMLTSCYMHPEPKRRQRWPITEIVVRNTIFAYPYLHKLLSVDITVIKSEHNRPCTQNCNVCLVLSIYSKTSKYSHLTHIYKLRSKICWLLWCPHLCLELINFCNR